MRSAPFSRAQGLMAAIGAILAMHTSKSVADSRIAELPAYESRGKGGARAHRPSGIAAVRRAARKTRNQARHRAACRRSRK